MIENLLTFPKVKNIIWRVNSRPRLFTIGYEGLTINQFIDKLLGNDIRILIDVRNNPISRKTGFSKSAFRCHLEAVGIKYQHIPELGIPSALRKNLGTKASYQSLFRHYERKILAYNLDYVEQIKTAITQFSRVALMCFESDYHTCHRHRITEYLSQDQSFKTSIVHLD
jgi:uncharacterized protein (DUF488 family)